MGALRLTRQDRMSEQMSDFAKELSALVMNTSLQIARRYYPLQGNKVFMEFRRILMTEYKVS